MTDNARNNLSSYQALAEHPPPPPSTVPPHALTSVLEVPEVRDEDISEAVPSIPPIHQAHILAPDVHMRLLEIENALNVATSSASSNITQPSSHDD